EPVAGESAHPVLVAMAEVLGMPHEILAALEKCFAQVGVAPPIADVPLLAGDDLEWAITSLVELHRMGDRLRVAEEFAALAQHLHGARERLLGRLPGQLRVARSTGFAGDPFGRHVDQATVPTDDGARRQV